MKAAHVAPYVRLIGQLSASGTGAWLSGANTPFTDRLAEGLEEVLTGSR
jgi:hypothetical protein